MRIDHLKSELEKERKNSNVEGLKRQMEKEKSDSQNTIKQLREQKDRLKKELEDQQSNTEKTSFVTFEKSKFEAFDAINQLREENNNLKDELEQLKENKIINLRRYTPNYLYAVVTRTIDVHVARENWKSFTKIAESFFI